MIAAPAPYVILPLLGADGSGKSTLARSLASIAQAIPRDVRLPGGMATVVDVRGGTQLHQIVDFANHVTEHSLLATSGARGAILVVSALDSVMPATRDSIVLAHHSHVPILAVALTKCDVIEDVDLLELVILEIRDALNASHFPGDQLPIIPLPREARRLLDTVMSRATG